MIDTATLIQLITGTEILSNNNQYQLTITKFEIIFQQF